MPIHLPDIVIAGLYQNSLVLIKEKAKQITHITHDDVQLQIEKWYLGENQKKILILITDTSATYINEEALDTLAKLLAACKLSLNDVAIVNCHHYKKSFNELKEQLQPQYLFNFDVTTTDIQLPFTIPHYQVQQYAGCTFMTAPLVTLTSDNSDVVKKEKRKLWNKLKTIFSV